MTRTYEIMFDLECDGLILQMFQCFFSIRKHHFDTVIAHMQSILSSCMRRRDAICRELQSLLLFAWRRAQLVSPIAYGLAERLVGQNIGLFRRQLTREEQFRFGGSCNKNEMRRKGPCFICKGPWGPGHSCLSDTGEMIAVDQGDILYVCQDEDSSLDESMGSYDDTLEEHEQSYRVDNSGPDMHPCVVEEYEDQLIVPMWERDQGVDERLMIQHREHIEEHESWRVIDIRPDSYDEQSVGPRRDIQDNVSPMMSQHK